MTDGERPISDVDLHAYLDGELDESRHAEVQRYLADHPDAAARLEEYHRLGQGLHHLYDPVLEESVPAHLSSRAQRPPTSWGLAKVAGVAMMMIVAGGTGWIARGEMDHRARPVPVALTPAMVDLVRPAAFAHAVYSPEVRHPVEVPGEQQEHLSHWLSKRLSFPIRAPALSSVGFELVGGRLLPSTNRMAAQFMYQDEAGNRVTLYLRRGVWGNRETAFRYAEQEGTQVLYWIDGPVGYALVGELGRAQMFALAEAIHGSLSRGS